MNPKETLTPYIQTQLQQGVPTEIITKQLIEHGWDAGIVAEVIRDITQPPTPPFPSLPDTEPALESADSAQTSEGSIGTVDVLESPSSLAQQEVALERPVLEDFGIRQAIREGLMALKLNSPAIGIIVIFIFVTLISIIIGFLVSGVLGAMSMRDSEMPTGLGSLVPLLAIAAVVMALFSAYVQSLLGLAIMDGAEGRKSVIKETFAIAAKRALRVLLSSLLYSLIVVSPTLVLVALIFFATSVTSGFSALTALLFIVGGASIALSLMLAMRYVMMPYVALFEPTISLFQIPTRTKKLMSINGMFFMIKFFIVMFGLNILLAAFVPSGKDGVSEIGLLAILLFILQAGLALLSAAVLVVFYRNRSIVRA